MSFSLSPVAPCGGCRSAKGCGCRPKKTPREPKPPEPPAPRRFRVLDVVTREVLLGDGSVREMLSLLGTVERMNDVNLYVWEPGGDAGGC